MTTAISLGVYLEQRRAVLAGVSHGLSGIRLEYVDSAELPAGGEDRLAAIRTLLGRVLFSPEYRCENMALSLGREGLLLRRMQLPQSAAASLEQVVEFEIEKHFPMASADLQTGFQAEEDAASKQLSLLLAAVPRKEYVAATSLFQEMGLNPSAVEFSGASLARLDDLDNKWHCRVFISDGAFEFSISRDQRLLHSSRHVFRAPDPTTKWEEIIAVAASAASTEQLPAPNRIEVFGPLDHLLKKNMPDKIFATGEWPTQLKTTFAAKGHDFSECAVALGAALSPLVENDFEPLNFLPHTQRQKKSRLEIWLCLTLAILAILISAIVLFAYDGKYRNISEERVKQAKATVPKLNEVEEAKREINILEKNLAAFKKLENARLLHLEVMKAITDSLPPGEGFLQSVTYNIGGTMFIRGYARKPLEFADKLKASDLFTGIDYNSETRTGDLTGFNVRAKVKSKEKKD